MLRIRKQGKRLAKAAFGQSFIAEAPIVIVACGTKAKSIMACGQPAYTVDVSIACADDTKLVAETDETNNCVATQSAAIEVAGPDLAETSVSDPPTTVFRGTGFKVTDTTQNSAAQAAGASSTRYYLSLDNTKGPEDILLEGSRAVPALESNGISENRVTVTVPGTTPVGTYNLLACADDTGSVAETDALNNCFASGQVEVQ